MIAIAALLTLICSSVVLAGSFTGTGASKSGRALSVCPAMFLLYPVKMQALYSSLLLKILLGVCIASICCFFSFSNHFMVSLDILFLFSLLIPVLFHTLKLAKISTVR